MLISFDSRKLQHPLHGPSVLLDLAEGSGQEADLTAAIQQAQAASVPWSSILTVLVPILMSLLTGGTIDWTAVIAAIIALINPPTPVP